MNLKYLRAFIVLVAALITIVYSMYSRINITDMLIRLLIVLIIFYVLGSGVIYVIRNIDDKANRMAIESEKQRIEEERIATNAAKIVNKDEEDI